MQDVGKILPAIFRKHILSENPKLSEILEALWSRVAGKSIAQHSRPIAFEAGVLTLGVSCPTWAAQLQTMAEEIRAEVNSFVGGPVVKKLKVRLVLSSDAVGLPRQPDLLASPLEAASSPLPDAELKIAPEIARILERSSPSTLRGKGKRPTNAPD